MIIPIQDWKEGMLEVNGSVQFMTNFRDLLLFWQDHYLHKDKDCSALEKVIFIYLWWLSDGRSLAFQSCVLGLSLDVSMWNG